MFSALVGEQASDLLRHLDLLASLPNVVGVLCGQVFVVLWLEQVQEVCRLGAHHHLSRVWLSWAHSVDNLVFRAERHLCVSVMDRGEIGQKLGYLQLDLGSVQGVALSG